MSAKKKPGDGPLLYSMTARVDHETHGLIKRLGPHLAHKLGLMKPLGRSEIIRRGIVLLAQAEGLDKDTDTEGKGDT